MGELPERLREAAHAHRPDRARMLARVERAIAASGPRPTSGHAHVGPDPGCAPGDAPPPPAQSRVSQAPAPKDPAPQSPAVDEPAPQDPARHEAGAPEPGRDPVRREPVYSEPAIREGGRHENGAHETRAHETRISADADRPEDGEQPGSPRKAHHTGATHDAAEIDGPGTTYDSPTAHASGTPHGRGAWKGAPAPWVRVAAVAAAVAGVIGLGGLAVGAASHDRDPGPPAVGPAHSAPVTTPPQGAGSADPSAGESRTPGTTPHPSTSATKRAGGRPGSRPATHTPAARTTGVTTPAGTGAANPSRTGQSSRQGGISARGGVSSGSNASWTEEDITLTVDQPLTALTVELRVAMTPGVSSTGQYDSIPALTSVSATVDGNTLVYRWTLGQGRTLGPGTYTFAGQFGHADGERDTGGDRFTVSAAGPDGSVSSGGGY